MMKFFFLLLILITSSSFPTFCISQELKDDYDKVYNMNPELYNGQVFTEIYRGNINGSQFFVDQDFVIGDLQLLSNKYLDQSLNYDVYNQKVLLSFEDKNGAQKIIELPLENVQSFYIYNKYFEVLDGDGKRKMIAQVFRFKKNKILIHWSKNLKSSASQGYTVRQFNSLKKKIWIIFDGTMYPINKNQDLISLYPIDKQSELKSWLKENKLKIKKAEDPQLTLIANYLDEM